MASDEQARESLNKLMKAISQRGLCPLDIIDDSRDKCERCAPSHRTPFRLRQCWRAWKAREFRR